MGEVLMQPMGGGVGSDDVTAAKAQVLAGYNTVTTDSDDEVVAGSMPNNGAWSASTAGNGSVTIPAGYHNGSGTVSGSASYNQGVSDADGRLNYHSVSYYQGVTDADGRVNTSSASYNSGYANGAAAKQATNPYKEFVGGIRTEGQENLNTGFIINSNGSVAMVGRGEYSGSWMAISVLNPFKITALRDGYYKTSSNGNRTYYSAGTTLVYMDAAFDRGFAVAVD